MNARPSPALATVLGRGARGRCPRCGNGRLFGGYLDIAARCPQCGLGFAGHDAGDAPAFVAIFLLGAVVVGLAVWVELTFMPPLWVHAALWAPVIIGGAALLLRPLKGMTVGLQYRFRSVDRVAHDDGGPQDEGRA